MPTLSRRRVSPLNRWRRVEPAGQTLYSKPGTMRGSTNVPITGISYGSSPVMVYVVGASPISAPDTVTVRYLLSTPGRSVYPRLVPNDTFVTRSTVADRHPRARDTMDTPLIGTRACPTLLSWKYSTLQKVRTRIVFSTSPSSRT
uniref:Uncharacterized protein n=1 Tax=Cacopsylla melanoneura TaxID=428564 RepID=A0A8D8SDG9_9HEMI